MRKSAPNLVLVCAIILCAGWPARAEGGRQPKGFVVPEEDQAVVYFLREDRFAGGAINLFLFSGTELVAVVPDGAYAYVILAPGKHVFWEGRLIFSPFEMTVEAGETYYVNVTTTMWKSQDLFLDDAIAQAQFEKLKFLYTPTDQDRQKAAKFARKHYAKAAATPPLVAGNRKYCDLRSARTLTVGKQSSIGILPLMLLGDSPYDQNLTDTWRRDFPKLLGKELQKRDFTNATPLEEGKSPESGLVIEGRIVEIKKGDIVATRANSYGYIRVDFTIRDVSHKVSFDVSCARAHPRSWVWTGTSTVNMHNSLEHFAERLADFFETQATPR